MRACIYDTLYTAQFEILLICDMVLADRMFAFIFLF